MGLKERQIIESGEAFKVKRELVQTLKLHYNSKEIVNFVSFIVTDIIYSSASIW